jgi:hypothetical protein
MILFFWILEPVPTVKEQNNRKTKNTNVGTGSKNQKNKIIERQKILLSGQVPKSKRTKS